MARTFYDEMYDASGAVRPHYQAFARWLADTPEELLAQRRREADLLFHRELRGELGDRLVASAANAEPIQVRHHPAQHPSQ